MIRLKNALRYLAISLLSGVVFLFQLVLVVEANVVSFNISGARIFDGVWYAVLLEKSISIVVGFFGQISQL